MATPRAVHPRNLRYAIAAITMLRSLWHGQGLQHAASVRSGPIRTDQVRAVSDSEAGGPQSHSTRETVTYASPLTCLSLHMAFFRVFNPVL